MLRDYLKKMSWMLDSFCFDLCLDRWLTTRDNVYLPESSSRKRANLLIDSIWIRLHAIKHSLEPSICVVIFYRFVSPFCTDSYNSNLFCLCHVVGMKKKTFFSMAAQQREIEINYYRLRRHSTGCVLFVGIDTNIEQKWICA